MIVKIAGDGQFLPDDSAMEELSERNAKLEAAVKLHDEASFKLALAELLAWVRSVGRVKPVVFDTIEPFDVTLPSEETTLYDRRPAFAAVALYRKLASDNPDRYRPDLADSLTNLSARLASGWPARLYEAAQGAKEAVALYRELASDNPDRYRPDLAASLNNLGARLSMLSALSRPDAVPVTEEAVALYRELASDNPDRYRPDLAASLNNLGARLSALGRPDAVPVTEEAVALYRELASDNPDRYRPGLAASLNNLGARLSMLSALSRPDAVPVTEEAVALYRELASDHRYGYRSGLAASLNNLGALLSTLGHPDAVPIMEEAAALAPPVLGALRAAVASGAPRSRKSAAYDDLVRRAFAELVQPGRLLFNPPDRMRLGDTERVEVRLTRTLTLDAELLENLRGHGEPQLEKIPTSPLMAVTLRGDGFQITPYSDEEQSVTQDGITTWEFDIRALKRGQQRLVISVSLRIPVAGQPLERKSIPVREATIDVQVGTPALIVHFVSANWQWFVGTAIAIAAVLVAVLH